MDNIPVKIERFSLYLIESNYSTPNRLFGIGDEIELPSIEFDTENLTSNDFLGGIDVPCFLNVKSCKFIIPIRSILSIDLTKKILNLNIVSFLVYGLATEFDDDNNLVKYGIQAIIKGLFSGQKTGSFKLGKPMGTEYSLEVLYYKLRRNTSDSKDYNDIILLDRLNNEFKIGGESIL